MYDRHEAKVFLEMSVQIPGLKLMKIRASAPKIYNTTYFLLVLFSVFVVFSMISAKSSNTQSLVNVCDDSTQWAPYSYSPKSALRVDSLKRTGSMIEILHEIFKYLELDYTLEPTNWNRCIKMVEDFAINPKYEVFINGARTPDREKRFFITDPIYTTHQGVFYLTKKFPTGPEVNFPNDLKNFKICGVRGNDYSLVGLSKNDFFTTGKTIEQVLIMLSVGRCEIVVSSLEPVYGSILVGNSMIPDDVSSIPIPNSNNPEFSIFISKGSPRGKDLQEKFNQAIAALKVNGVWDKIFDKYRALLQTN